MASHSWLNGTARAPYRVGGFRFSGPAGLGVGRAQILGRAGAVGRRNPTFIVGPLSDLGTRWVLEGNSEVSTVGGRPALSLQSSAFAPGHGGRDHRIWVYIPSLEAGVSVDFRTHDEDLDASLGDHIEARRCRLWAEGVISSLEWDPPD